jgi:hypothetical protein
MRLFRAQSKGVAPAVKMGSQLLQGASFREREKGRERGEGRGRGAEDHVFERTRDETRPHTPTNSELATPRTVDACADGRGSIRRGRGVGGGEDSIRLDPVPISAFWKSKAQFDAAVVAQRRRHVESAARPSARQEMRLALAEIVVSRPYRLLKLLVVLLHLGGQAMERQLIPPSQRQILQIIYAVTSAAFLWDFIMEVIGLGFFHYTSSVYNLLDFIALVASLVDHLWALAFPGVFSDEPGGQLATGASRLAVVRCLRAIGAPRLYFSTRALTGAGSQLIFLALESALGKMVPTALLVFAALTGFAVLGMHLLGGIMGSCSDPVVFRREDCVGADSIGAPRTWSLHGLNFGWFGSAMESVWVVASSNDWPELMWRAVDSTEPDTGPFENHNLAMALFFFGIAAFSLLVLLNLFISVFVCVYLAQVADASTQPSGLVFTAPRGRPTRGELPIIRDYTFKSRIRTACYSVLKSWPASVTINFAIFGTLATMLAESYHMSAAQKQVVTGLDVWFTLIFGTELVLRLASMGISGVSSDQWMCFDYLIYAFGVADLIFDTAVVGKWMRSAR